LEKWHNVFGIDAVKSLIGPLIAAKAHSPLIAALLIFVIYVAVTGLFIPFEIPMALMTGALFGLVDGVILASFASGFGATFAFLAAHFLLRDYVQTRFAPQPEIINRGIAHDGVFYLINLRLLPFLPFTLCNIFMGLKKMPVGVFYVVSQASMIFATVVFVNAGTQLLTLRSLGNIVSLRLIIALAALAVLPCLGKGLLYGINAWRRRRPRAA